MAGWAGFTEDELRKLKVSVKDNHGNLLFKDFTLFQLLFCYIIYEYSLVLLPGKQKLKASLSYIPLYVTNHCKSERKLNWQPPVNF